MLIISSIAYGLAFRVGSISAILGFVIKSILIHWLGFGIIMASLGSLIANKHLMQAERSSSHVKQNVEWLYAFDVHCNAFVPLFVLLCKFLYCCYYFLFVCLDVYHADISSPSWQMEYNSSYCHLYWGHLSCH